MSDDGKKGWSLDITATPNAAGDAVSLASDVELWTAAGSRRHASTKMLVKEGDPAAFEVTPQSSLPPMRVEISVHGI